MNRFRWLILLVIAGQCRSIINYFGQATNEPVIVAFLMFGLAAQIGVFIFGKSPFTKDGQGGYIQFPVRRQRQPERD